MTWQISVPYRFPDESLVDVASHCRTLEGDERDVARTIVLEAAVDGLRTAGELIDRLEALEPHERRAMLDHARAEVGLEPTAAVDARRYQPPLAIRSSGGASFPTCAGCDTAPTRHGIFYRPDVRRWWCPAHEHEAQPGDLEPIGSGIKLSPAGVPIPDDPAADAGDREREASRRAQLQAQAEIRAVEAAELHASNQARDTAHRRELPAHLRPRTAA
jgi:hypothetical protein